MPEQLMDDSNALGMLRQEHESIKALIENVRGIDDLIILGEALEPLLMELRIHSAIEDEYFLPFVSKHLHPELVTQSGRDNHHIDMLTDRLVNNDTNLEQVNETLDNIASALQHHIYEMEQQIFLRSEGRDPDFNNQLTALANAMKRRKQELMVELQNREGTRSQDVRHRIAQEEGRGLRAGRDVVLEDELSMSEDVGRDFSIGADGKRVNMGGRSDMGPNDDVGERPLNEPNPSATGEQLPSSMEEMDDRQRGL